ncbi:MAG: hypothetical protein WA705_20655 [Candidatus Ozemobacteraceae bacterium]
MKRYFMEMIVVISLLVLFSGGAVAAVFGAQPERVICTKQLTKAAHLGGEISVNLDWLERPGDFALTISYWGQLTQEGPVNVWISLNGIERNFVTLTELSNRRQTVRIMSYQPTTTDSEGKNTIRPLEDFERVDPEFFRNAAYYAPFGQNTLEFKFFANGRWEGDPTKSNENYVVTFAPSAS